MEKWNGMRRRMIAGIDIGGTKCASILGVVDAKNQLEVLKKPLFQRLIFLTRIE